MLIYIVLFGVSVLFGGLFHILAKLVFKTTQNTAVSIWTGTGFPMGVAVGLFYVSGILATALAMLIAGSGGLLGAFIVEKAFNRKKV